MASLNASAAEYRAASPAAIERVASAVKSGDTVILTNGVWTDAHINFRTEAHPAKPVVIRAETAGGVTLTGDSWLRLAGYNIVVQDLVFRGCAATRDLVSFRLDPKEGATKVRKSFFLPLKAHHCRVTHCAFLDCDPTDPAASTRWISLFGSQNRVDHCLFQGKTGPGAMIAVVPGGETPEHLIDHNIFAQRERSQGVENEILRIGETGAEALSGKVVVESNLFQACACGPEIIANKTCDNIYAHNTFRLCAGSLSLRSGAGCTAEGNYFLGGSQPLAGGIALTDDGHRVVNNYFAGLRGTGEAAPLSLAGTATAQGTAKGSIIAFNTVVNCKTGLAAVLPQAGRGAFQGMIANNLFKDCGAGPLDHADLLDGLNWAGNLSDGSPPAAIAGQWMSVADLKLVPDKDQIWRPAPDSPARGAADPRFTQVSEDIDGQPREGPKDAGCDQLSAAPVTHPLPPAADPGIRWLEALASGRRGESSISREREVQE